MTRKLGYPLLTDAAEGELCIAIGAVQVPGDVLHLESGMTFGGAKELVVGDVTLRTVGGRAKLHGQRRSLRVATGDRLGVVGAKRTEAAPAPDVGYRVPAGGERAV